MAAVVALAGAAAVAGCDGSATPEESPTEVPLSTRLVLTVEPTSGDAPLDVVLTASLEGPIGDGALSRCPGLAWVMGDGAVLIAKAQNCEEGEVPRTFTSTHTYESAGSFDAGVKLIALDIPVSDPVQVLVRGSTPTPAPLAAAFGPTIVVATPGATRSAPTRAVAADTQAVARGATLRPVAEATLRAAGEAARAAGEAARPAGSTPTSIGGPGSRVLPADLYFVARDDRRLWTIPASGGAPNAVTGPGESVDEYAVSASGLTAYVDGGALRLVVPGSEPLVVAESGASSPVWSRDGRRLAYQADRVWLYDMVGGRRSELGPRGRPAAFSRDGRWLLVEEPESAMVIDVDTRQERELPVGDWREGGWLADRDVVWLAEPGLRLITVRDTLLVSTLFERGGARHVFIRPDLQLLVWVEDGSGWTPNVVDLAEPVLAARPIGPTTVQIESGDFAWSPDGRHGALAGPDGLELVDPVTGASVLLEGMPAANPQWVLGK